MLPVTVRTFILGHIGDSIRLGNQTMNCYQIQARNNLVTSGLPIPFSASLFSNFLQKNFFASHFTLTHAIERHLCEATARTYSFENFLLFLILYQQIQ